MKEIIIKRKNENNQLDYFKKIEFYYSENNEGNNLETIKHYYWDTETLIWVNEETVNEGTVEVENFFKYDEYNRLKIIKNTFDNGLE